MFLFKTTERSRFEVHSFVTSSTLDDVPVRSISRGETMLAFLLAIEKRFLQN